MTDDSTPEPGDGGARFAELLAHDGVVETVEIGSQFGFMAFHGGSLERMTDVVASAAAAASGASLYTVRLPAALRWHVPSRDVDPAASPPLAAFLDHVDVAVAVHGYGRDQWWTRLLAGGTNRDLAAAVRAAVEPRLAAHDPGYAVVDELDEIPAELRGLHPDNPINRCRGGGVQLELPPRVRGMGPFWTDHHRDRPGELTPHTRALIDGLAAAATSWQDAAPRRGRETAAP